MYGSISLHEGVTFYIHFLICTGSTLFTLVARRMRLGLAYCARANVCAFMIIYCALVVWTWLYTVARVFTINISATAKKVSGPGRGQGSQVHHITKSGFDTKKSLTNRNNQDSAITYVKLLVVMYLHWCFWKIGCLSSPCSKILKMLQTQ